MILSDNANISVGRRYNGSGPRAFGGQKSWPVVELEIPFHETQEENARRFANALRKFVARYDDSNAKKT